MTDSEAYSLINRRRRQVYVHSCIYYRFNTSIVEDHLWDKWARELVELQKTYPDIAKTVPFADIFDSFDGSTGFNLPLDNNCVINKALQLLRIHKTFVKNKNPATEVTGGIKINSRILF